MRSSINFQITFFFILAFTLVSIVSYFYFKSTEDFLEAANKVNINQQVVTQLEVVISLLKDVETGERGFIITRQEKFLEPFSTAIGKLSSEIAHLESLISGMEDQQARFAKAKPLISKAINIYRSNVELIKNGKYLQVQEIVANGTGKNALDKIRESIGEMIMVEKQALARLDMEVENKAYQNFLFNVTGVGITVSLMLFGMITIVNNIRQQQKLQHKLQQLNTELNISNQELTATIEELQTANEELFTTNEKLNDSNNKLQELNAKVVHVNKELESFSYSISHDLRTPLRAVVGFSSILQETCQDQLNAEAKRLLGIISSNALMMGEMIDGLLEFARLGKKALAKAKINMNRLIIPILEEQKNNYITSNTIQVDLELLPDVVADPQLMKQVWSNLLANAFKFTSRKETPVITIGCQEKEHEFVFFVKDNGAGFDMQYADNLFGVFKRYIPRMNLKDMV